MYKVNCWYYDNRQASLASINAPQGTGKRSKILGYMQFSMVSQSEEMPSVDLPDMLLLH